MRQHLITIGRHRGFVVETIPVTTGHEAGEALPLALHFCVGNPQLETSESHGVGRAQAIHYGWRGSRVTPILHLQRPNILLSHNQITYHSKSGN